MRKSSDERCVDQRALVLMREGSAASLDPMKETSRRTSSAHRIMAVVVTYNADPATFEQLLASTTPQVERVFVLDNGSLASTADRLERLCAKTVEFHRLGHNLGIARAQNQGAALARLAGASDILFLDHDSDPAPDMVAMLCDAADALRAESQPVAAVGPLIVDRRTGIAAPLPRVIGSVVVFEAADSVAPSRCEYLIASGMLVAVAAFERVGPMNEAFFIDQVDVEWCLRAGAAAMHVFSIPAARLRHAIGDARVRFWAFGWRELAVHSPVRDYFYFRNSMRLILSSQTPVPWRRFWRRRLIRLFVLQALFVAPRLRRCKAMLSGLWVTVSEQRRTRDF